MREEEGRRSIIEEEGRQRKQGEGEEGRHSILPFPFLRESQRRGEARMDPPSLLSRSWTYPNSRFSTNPRKGSHKTLLFSRISRFSRII